MSRRVAAEGYSDDVLPEEDDEEMHWVLERLGEASIVLVVASLVVALLGLGVLAVAGYVSFVELTPVGKTLVAAGSLGAMSSMVLATLVAVVSGTFSPM
jgi:hypothetical protein